MVQIALPDADIVAGSWTAVGGPSTLFDAVDDGMASDSEYMEDIANNTTAELGLQTVTDPVGNIGHILRVRLQGNGSGGPERCQVALFEGATQRAISGFMTSRAAWDTQTYTLTTGEADAITAYTDLRIKIISSNLGGGETMWVSGAEFEVPDAPAGGADELGAISKQIFGGGIMSTQAGSVNR